MRSLAELIKLHPSATTALVRFRGALRGQRPVTLDAGTKAHLDELTRQNEGLLRLVKRPSELAKFFEEIRAEKVADGLIVIAVCRHLARQIPALVDEFRQAVSRIRRDTSLTFPGVLDRAGDEATRELLRLGIYDRLSRATPAQLFSTYLDALNRRDSLRAFYEAEGIESLADGGALVPATEADLPVLKALRDHVEGVQDLRVPLDLPDFDGLLDKYTGWKHGPLCCRRPASIPNVTSRPPRSTSASETPSRPLVRPRMPTTRRPWLDAQSTSKSRCRLSRYPSRTFGHDASVVSIRPRAQSSCPYRTVSKLALSKRSTAASTHEFFNHWSKQTAKSFTAGAWLTHHTVADPHHRGERLSGIASNDEDQSDVIFRECAKIIGLDPWLSKHVVVHRDEILYRERRTDPKTGGRFILDHRILKLPRDLKGTHGLQFTHIVRDEVWSEPDHGFSESLIITPACPTGGILYASYFPPHVLMRSGAPFFDLMRRVEEKDGSLFYSYIGGTGADAPSKVAPWIDQKWIDRQEKILQASPSRFKRIILNLPAGADAGGLITAAELKDALAPLVEPAAGSSGTMYYAAVDLGVKVDWSTCLIGHIDEDGRLVIDVIRTWKPSASSGAVSLMAVSQELRDLHARFPWRRLCFDQSQSRLIAEQLTRQSIPAEVLEIGSADVNRLTMGLKGCFARRLVRLPSSATDLVEQLESVQAVETRRGLLKLKEGSPSSGDARAHDDLCFALALLCDMTSAELGRAGLPESFTQCNRRASGLETGDCFLYHGVWKPPLDAICRACPGLVAVRTAYDSHVAGGGERMPLTVFRERYIGDNQVTTRAAWSRLTRDTSDWYS